MEINIFLVCMLMSECVSEQVCLYRVYTSLHNNFFCSSRCMKRHKRPFCDFFCFFFQAKLVLYFICRVCEWVSEWVQEMVNFVKLQRVNALTEGGRGQWHNPILFVVFFFVISQTDKKAVDATTKKSFSFFYTQRMYMFFFSPFLCLL